MDSVDAQAKAKAWIVAFFRKTEPSLLDAFVTNTHKLFETFVF